MTQRIMQFLQRSGDVFRNVWAHLRRFYVWLPNRVVTGVHAWKKPGNKNLPGALKKKGVFCSAEAAMISVGFHLLLLLFAGSIVAVQYVQKHNAEFVGENIERPKLERRQLQMPVKLQNMQKKGQRPKVTSRMATAASSTFALPDMAGSGLPGQAGGFARVGGNDSSTGMDLSKLGSAGSLGFGVSGVNFFGARSSGEKIVFVISASKLMMEDRKGGYVTYKFVKDRIHQMISGMKAATLFNVIVYSDRNVSTFRPELVPASGEAKKQVLDWLEPLNKDSAKVGQVSADYKPPVVYESDMANDGRHWLKAVQAGMEQSADNIFVLCAGWEANWISEAQRGKLFGLTPEEKKKRLEAKGWTESRINEYTRKRAENYAKARAILEEENKARAAKGLPPKVVQDLWYYTYYELKIPPLGEAPPDRTDEFAPRRYSVEQVLKHLDTVYQYNYIPKKLDKPKVHFVCLIDEEGHSLSDGGLDVGSEGMALLRKVSGQYRGGFEFLRGSKKTESLLKNDPSSRE